jgi:ABC-type polysaccharide/polyol phosphate export permease
MTDERGEMKFAARCFVFTFAAVMVLRQLASFGMKEGWGVLALSLGVIALLLVSVWYGFLRDDE